MLHLPCLTQAEVAENLDGNIDLKWLHEAYLRTRRDGATGVDGQTAEDYAVNPVLAKALDTDDSPARARMRHRWPIVMVDEFQDTDRVQWEGIDRAFSGHSTVILIGDPKQAIYAFRGGDIVTYLEAANANTPPVIATVPGGC